jgi:outer membrane protein OmpA-like peptidoglycan-associated protein
LLWLLTRSVFVTTTRRQSFTLGTDLGLFSGLSALLLSVACGGATAPTTELQTARNVYAEARNGEAAQLNPTGVHAAQKALKAAEAVHDDDAGSERERHYAYIALRRSELAISEASEALAKKEQQRAEATYQAQLEQQSRDATQESTQYAQQLTQTQQALQQNSQSLQQQKQQLEEARIAAEQAKAELRQSEAVKEEQGRMVISLSGVLFQAGGAQLSEPAQRRLETVVQALRAYPDRAITVEGYTDAQGSDEINKQLSLRRADAVREYLQQRGIEAERLRAVGKGEENPVASNDTAEGRANNRRVEIIVDREGSASRSAEVSSSGASDRQNVSGKDSEVYPGGAASPARTTPAVDPNAPAPPKAAPPAPPKAPAQSQSPKPAAPPRQPANEPTAP